MKPFLTILGFATSALLIAPNLISKQESLAVFFGLTMGYLFGKLQGNNSDQPQGTTTQP